MDFTRNLIHEVEQEQRRVDEAVTPKLIERYRRDLDWAGVNGIEAYHREFARRHGERSKKYRNMMIYYRFAIERKQ